MKQLLPSVSIILIKFKKIVPENSIKPPQRQSQNTKVSEKNGLCIYWKIGKRTTIWCTRSQDVEEFIEVVGSFVKKYKNSTIKQIQLLKDIWKCKSTTFDPNSREHIELLKRLWQKLNPNIVLDGLVSPQWKMIGFQGNNPGTDFRGMGLLGLLNLIFFAENYTEKIKTILSLDNEYPFAVTGINITNMLLQLLDLTEDLVNSPVPDTKWHNSLLTLFYYADNDDTFDELYCQSFLLFDTVWTHMNATYMNFPTILQKVRGLLEDLLGRKPLNLKQLIAWIEQIRVAYSEKIEK